MAGKYALLRLRASTPEAEPVTEVNIIPVIDVSLVLLVILFVSAPLLSYPNLPVELPKATSSTGEDKTLTVTYTRKGELAVGSQVTDWDAFPARLKEAIAARPAAPIVLRVDKSVPYRVVERLMTACKEAGGGSLALATEGPK